MPPYLMGLCPPYFTFFGGGAERLDLHGTHSSLHRHRHSMSMTYDIDILCLCFCVIFNSNIGDINGLTLLIYSLDSKTRHSKTKCF